VIRPGSEIFSIFPPAQFSPTCGRANLCMSDCRSNFRKRRTSEDRRGVILNSSRQNSMNKCENHNETCFHWVNVPKTHPIAGLALAWNNLWERYLQRVMSLIRQSTNPNARGLSLLSEVKTGEVVGEIAFDLCIDANAASRRSTGDRFHVGTRSSDGSFANPIKGKLRMSRPRSTAVTRATSNQS
jgi:hypothetical protein